MTAPRVDEWEFDQVYAAIERLREQKVPGETQLRGMAVAAYTLAFGAVQCLAAERGISVEAVLDELIGASAS